MLHEMTRMVVGSGPRFFLSQPRFGGRSALLFTASRPASPGVRCPQNESEGDEGLGGLGLRDVTVRTHWQPSSRIDKAHVQGSQRSSRRAWGPLKKKACSHACLVRIIPSACLLGGCTVPAGMGTVGGSLAASGNVC